MANYYRKTDLKPVPTCAQQKRVRMAAAETAFHAALLNDPSSTSLRRGVATPRHLPSIKGGLKDVLPSAERSDFNAR